MMSRLYYPLVFVQAFFFVVTVRGGPCNTGEQIVTNAAGGMLYSLNYPLNYGDGLTCKWTLTSSANSKVVQLETIDIDVESPDGSCTGDYIVAYDGNNANAPLLKKWCGTDKAVVRSTGQSLFLKFSSNGDRTRKGFSIAYSEITPFDASCKDGQLTTLTVDSTPTIYTLLHPKTNIRECKWKFVAQGSNQLTVSVDTATGILPCRDSYLTVHDGADASAPEILRWCRNSASSRPSPFSAFYPSGAAVIVLHVKDLSKVQSLSLQLTVKAHTRLGRCPPIAVEKFAAPVFLSMPYTVSPGGASCPAKFLPAKSVSTAFRVDVLRVNNQAASCSSAEVSVYQGDTVDAAKALAADCWNKTRPMFLASANGDVTVTTQAGTTSVVQIIATGVECTGFLTQKQALKHVEKFRLPDKNFDYYGYNNFCVMRMLLEAAEANQHPRIVTAAFFNTNFDRPSTLTLYNGQNTKSPVLYTVSGPALKHQVIGTGRYVLLEFSTAGLENTDFVNGEFSQAPVTSLCNTVNSVSLTASSEKQTLTSINYPNQYPTEFGCRYNIRTNTKGEVVYLNVVEAKFGDQCDDYLIVSDSNSYSIDDRLGYVCRGNPSFPRRMQSSGDALYLEFYSSNPIPDRPSGSWKVEYFSAPANSSKGDDTNDDDNKTAAIVGGVLGVIIAILIVVIIILVLRIKKCGNSVM